MADIFTLLDTKNQEIDKLKRQEEQLKKEAHMACIIRVSYCIVQYVK